MSIDPKTVANMVDHTLLAPEATRLQLANLVKEAQELETYSVCVSPNMVPLIDENNQKIELGNIKLAVVCGFPSGAHKIEVKAREAEHSVADGVDEIDMVINLTLAKEHRYAELESEISAVRKAASNVVLKVILETGALTDAEIVDCCKVCEQAGANFVKTSTGFHKMGGATIHAIELMSRTVGGKLGVKASGGIRDGKFATQLIEAGATRLGLSGTRKVLETL